MPQRKLFVATQILLFDFELFIGGYCDFGAHVLHNTGKKTGM
jgi:hypothetical protein